MKPMLSVSYLAIHSNGQIKRFNSPQEAAEHFQIDVRNVRLAIQNFYQIEEIQVWFRKIKHLLN